jgi:hypothetical protein
VVARFVHTEEVTGSNPVSPTVAIWPLACGNVENHDLPTAPRARYVPDEPACSHDPRSWPTACRLAGCGDFPRTRARTYVVRTRRWCRRRSTGTFKQPMQMHRSPSGWCVMAEVLRCIIATWAVPAPCRVPEIVVETARLPTPTTLPGPRPAKCLTAPVDDGWHGLSLCQPRSCPSSHRASRHTKTGFAGVDAAHGS